MENTKVTILKENIGKRIVGKEDVIEKLVIALLAGGHVLLEDVPGVGKTTLAKALADSVNCSFARIQFTPDTLPSDVTGMTIYNMQSGSFETIKGPIINQIVLADEINRTSPKTQASLLEAMEEHQVTIDGTTFQIAEPFMVIATENPMDSIGTYSLPEAQLDRFMMKLSIGYPDTENAVKMAKKYLEGSLKEETTSVLTAEEIVVMKKDVENVTVHEDCIQYIVDIIKQTRVQDEVQYGASPRAVLSMLRASHTKAYICGRDYVIPEDIIEMSKLVLSHRLILRAEAKMGKWTGKQVVEKILEQVKVPGIR